MWLHQFHGDSIHVPLDIFILDRRGLCPPTSPLSLRQASGREIVRPFILSIIVVLTRLLNPSQTCQTNLKSCPLSVAHTTGAESRDLLYALLETANFDGISNADNFTAIRNYVRYQGKADERRMMGFYSGRTSNKY